MFVATASFFASYTSTSVRGVSSNFSVLPTDKKGQWGLAVDWVEPFQSSWSPQTVEQLVGTSDIATDRRPGPKGGGGGGGGGRPGPPRSQGPQVPARRLAKGMYIGLDMWCL
jgi:hypothetical protein